MATAMPYFRVAPKFWPKARARGWNDQQINLALYLLTCTHRKLEGLYVLPKAYIASDLGWPAKRVEETLQVIVDSGFAQYDEAAQVVFIPKALKHQSPGTGNHVKGAIRQLRALPRTCLWDAFRMACASHCPRLADAIEEEWPSHPDGVSRVREHARGEASSSSSNSNSSPPQPPAERGEQEPDRSAQGQEPPPNSRAHGTNPRALAQAAQADAGEHAATRAAAALSPPTDEHSEAWERVRSQMKRAVSESTWAIHLDSTLLIGTSDGVLVADAPDETRAWVTSRFERLVKHCADAEGVPLRLATGDEHRGVGLARVAA